MSEFYAFAGEHWFLTWCALWLVWGLVWLAGTAMLVSFRAINRVLRTIMVAIRGWPPAHLDADGDWPPAASKEGPPGPPGPPGPAGRDAVAPS